MKRKPFLGILALALFLGACEEQVRPPNPGAGPGFDLEVVPQSLSLAPGASGSLSLRVAPRGGFRGHPPGAGERAWRGFPFPPGGGPYGLRAPLLSPHPLRGRGGAPGHLFPGPAGHLGWLQRQRSLGADRDGGRRGAPSRARCAWGRASKGRVLGTSPGTPFPRWRGGLGPGRSLLGRSGCQERCW